MQRRTLLKLGIGSAAALAVAGGAVALWTPGIVHGRVSTAGREVFHAVGRGVLDGLLPVAEHAQHQALSGLLDRIDNLVAGLPPHAQDELSQLVALLATAPGRLAFAGLQDAWMTATTPEIQSALHSMRFSSLALRRQSYHALHDIVNGAYFADPATWVLLGYPGPVALA